MIQFLLPLLTLIFCLNTQSHANDKPIPLVFQADKNNIQVLPQRFEYTLLDEHRLKIGDIIIDSETFGFQISNTKGFSIKFAWPAGLMTSGNIVIKDNSGKALFSTIIDPKDLSIKTMKSNEDEIRRERAEYIVRDLPAQLFEDMKYVPFMSFCIFRESRGTRLHLCSQELYVSSQEGKTRIKARTSTKKTAFVEINGKVVGRQGIIFLNDAEEDIYFRSLSESGATLEIETRMKPVDFLDVTSSEDDKEILITARGAEPVNSRSAKLLPNGDWQIRLNPQRPILYLKGEGDIPMRQEFFIKGSLPKENGRPFISPRSQTRTYGSNLTYTGITRGGWSPSSFDELSQVEKDPRKENQFKWNIREIPSGVPTRRFIKVTQADKEYVAGYDIFRGRPYSLQGQLGYNTPSGIADALVAAQMWFENFLAMESNLFKFRWGTQLEWSQQLNAESGADPLQSVGLSLLYRLTPGFQLVEPSSTVGIHMRQMTMGSTQLSSFALSYQHQHKFPNESYFKDWMDWWIQEVRYTLPAQSGLVKLKTNYELSTKALNEISNGLYFESGLRYSMLEFEGTKGEGQIGIFFGTQWIF